MAKQEKTLASENRDQKVDVTKVGQSDNKEADRKTSLQDRTAFQNTDHVKYNLDVDPNDPRNRPATPKLPSLDD